MNNIKLFFLSRIAESSSLRGLYLVAFAAISLGYGEYLDQGILIGLGVLGILSVVLPDKFKSIDAIIDSIKNNLDLSKSNEIDLNFEKSPFSGKKYFDTTDSLTQEQIDKIKG